jgi:hypothetical protein
MKIYSVTLRFMRTDGRTDERTEGYSELKKGFVTLRMRKESHYAATFNL